MCEQRATTFVCSHLLTVADDTPAVLEFTPDDPGVPLLLTTMWIKYTVGAEAGRVSIDDNYYLHLLS